MNKHTPGPWQTQYRKGADSMNRTEIFSEQYGGIASCDWTPKHCGNGVTETYREANARLIAAAPELMEALQWAVRQNSHDMLMTGEELRKCEAAINKATGGTP